VVRADSAYGAEDLKALIDAAHLHGRMVFLDVVYNHLAGGNYLALRAGILHASADAMGSAIDYRVPQVRASDRECAALAARLSLRRAAADA